MKIYVTTYDGIVLGYLDGMNSKHYSIKLKTSLSEWTEARKLKELIDRDNLPIDPGRDVIRIPTHD